MMNPEATVLAYLDAIAKKDLGRLEALVTPDVRFIGPAATRNGFRELREAFERITAIHVRSDIQRVFSDGNEVCVIYDFVTDTVGTLPTIEWIKLDRGRIASIRLYYDQLVWQNMRDEMVRRTQA